MSSRSSMISFFESPMARSIFDRKGVPHPLVKRFVAGDQLSDALKVASSLRDEFILATLDYLGENLLTAQEIEDAVGQYQEVIKALSTFYPDAHVSVKLTAIGLLVGPEAAKENLLRIVDWAKERDNIFIRVDMESSEHTQITLDLVSELHKTYSNVGTVIQSYLRRSDADVAKMCEEKISVRLVKGAYAETPMVAYSQKSDVDKQFRKQCFALLENGTQPAFATHDQQLIKDAKLYARQKAVPKENFDFEMLMGVRRDLQKQLSGEGHRLRVYIPYGAQWYPYFTRRLAERPANLGFVMKNLFKG